MLYSTKINGWNQPLFWEKCKNHKYTVVVIRTNYDKIIGGYMTDTWKKTNYKFVDEPTFIYYFDKEEIKICH
jgi:hypothetical protein